MSIRRRRRHKPAEYLHPREVGPGQLGQYGPGTNLRWANLTSSAWGQLHRGANFQTCIYMENGCPIDQYGLGANFTGGEQLHKGRYPPCLTTTKVAVRPGVGPKSAVRRGGGSLDKHENMRKRCDPAGGRTEICGLIGWLDKPFFLTKSEVPVGVNDKE